MADETRNPYLILQVPYGSDSRQANAAFAKAAIRIKKGESPWTQEDLTWALEQVENAHKKEEFAHYRIPANPDIINPPLFPLA
jgi:hypothetical protein